MFFICLSEFVIYFPRSEKKFGCCVPQQLSTVKVVVLGTHQRRATVGLGTLKIMI